MSRGGRPCFGIRMRASFGRVTSWSRWGTPTGCVIVTEGQLEVIVPIDNSEEYRRLSLIDEGSVFGEQSFLDGRPRSAHIRAVTSGRMRVMSMRALERLADEEPKLAQAILLDLGRIVSERLRQTTALMNTLYTLASES